MTSDASFRSYQRIEQNRELLDNNLMKSAENTVILVKTRDVLPSIKHPVTIVGELA